MDCQISAVGRERAHNSRGQQRVAVMRATLAVTAALVLGSSCTSGHHVSSARPAQPASTMAAAPTAPAATTTTAQPSGRSASTTGVAGPHVDVQLLRTNARGAPHLELR